MLALTTTQINEIAQEIDCGNLCYLNLKTSKLIFTPDFDSNIYADKEFYEEELEELENNWGDYAVIEKPSSNVSFNIMVDFTEQLEENNPLRNILFNALNKKKPFSQFKFEIDNSGEYRQKWFDFKQQKLENWVVEKFKEIRND